MSDEGPRKGMDEGMWISILILIGLVLIGFWYVPRLVQSRSLRMAKETSMMQTARSINLLMFMYANDHDGKYPTGKSSTEVFQKLVDEGYCGDLGIFYFSMPGKTEPTSKKLELGNVCWDVTVPVTDKDSDWLPIVFPTGYRMTYAPGGSAIPLKASVIKTTRFPLAYKNNSAMLIKDDGLPDHIVPKVIAPAFSAGGKTFQQLTPDGPLKP